MTDVVWGAEIAASGTKPDWLDGDDTLIWMHWRETDYWSELNDGNWPLGSWSLFDWSQIDKFRLRADHPHYAQTSPADAVTIARMTEAEASKFGLARGYGPIDRPSNPAECHYYGAMRDLGLIKEKPSRAQTIATKTGLSVKDVGAVLTAIGEGE